MIVFLTLVYVGLLFVLTRMKVVPNTAATWLTVILYDLVLLIAFFIPMQWGAPAGSAHVMAYSVTITPNVTGQVTEVPVEPNVPLSAGDVLFKIDPTQYQAALDGLVAQLELARTRLEQSQALVERDAGSVYELQAYQAQVSGLEAQIANAEYNLAETVVRAPSDGYVTYVGLRPGARVSNLPLFRAMSFIDTEEKIVGAQVMQIHARYIEPGQTAELSFKYFPGKIFQAKVVSVLPVTAQGQLQVTGLAAQPMSTTPGPFFVRLELDDPAVLEQVPAGSIGEVAIYTQKIKAAHVIRKVMIRMGAIMNYIKPT